MCSRLWESHLLYQAMQSQVPVWCVGSWVESICALWTSSGSLLVVLVVLVVRSNDNIEDRLHVYSPKGLYTVLQGYVGMNQGDSERASVVCGSVPWSNWYYNPSVLWLGTFHIGNRAIVPSSGIKSSHPPEVLRLFYHLWEWRFTIMVMTAMYYPCDVLGGNVLILYPTYASV